MYKFACTDKFVMGTFSINCIKDLGWCQSIELYFVADIYQPDRLTFSSEIMHDNLQPKMIETKAAALPSSTSTVYYKCISLTH